MSILSNASEGTEQIVILKPPSSSLLTRLHEQVSPDIVEFVFNPSCFVVLFPFKLELFF